MSDFIVTILQHVLLTLGRGIGSHMALNILHLLTLLSSGLIAGLFYAYSCSVNNGLGRLHDAAYLRAMQSINRAILNPLFFLSFFGTLILLPLSTWLEYRLVGTTTAFYFLTAGSILYFFGVFLTTALGSVPLNDALEAFDLDEETDDGIRKQRRAFESPWNRYHRIRTVANVLAFAAAIWAFLQ